MNIEPVIFYFFSTVLVLAAMMVILVRNPVHAVLFLVLTFFTCAAIWILLEAEFLAIVLVLVYVGAVMVLFLFVVMMLDINIVPLREGFMRYLPIGIFVALLILIEMTLVVGPEHFGIDSIGTGVENGLFPAFEEKIIEDHGNRIACELCQPAPNGSSVCRGSG